jgi:hypothetical protein
MTYLAAAALIGATIGMAFAIALAGIVAGMQDAVSRLRAWLQSRAWASSLRAALNLTFRFRGSPDTSRRPVPLLSDAIDHMRHRPGRNPAAQQPRVCYFLSTEGGEEGQ